MICMCLFNIYMIGPRTANFEFFVGKTIFGKKTHSDSFKDCFDFKKLLNFVIRLSTEWILCLEYQKTRNLTYFCCNFVQNKATGKNIWLYLQSSNMYHHLNIAQNMPPLHFHNFSHCKAIIFINLFFICYNLFIRWNSQS